MTACSPIIPRKCINSRPPCAPEFRQALSDRNLFAYQWINHRHSHAAVPRIEGEKDQNQQDTEPRRAIRRVQTVAPNIRFITFDQAQHDFGTESRELWERERYSDHIARLLLTQSVSQRKEKRLVKSTSGKNKEDKLFVNMLLKDKGLASHDWRIALSDLQKHYIPENIDELKDSDISDHVRNVVQNAVSLTRDIDGSHGSQSSGRRVMSRSRNFISFRLARYISPPTEWSEAKLAVFVEALAESQRTQTRVAWAQKPRLKGWTNIGDILAAYDMVFYSTALEKFLSIEACNTALRFFYDHGMMSKARSLYIRMEDLKMQIPTETFNILLRGSASQRDLHNFTFLLNNMTRRGFKPNEKTWILFIQVIGSISVRAVIVRKMAEMKMLDKIGIRRVVAAHMVSYEIINHLGDGHDHHSFLDHMDSKFGIGWLSTTAGNELLHEVAKRKSAVESLSLLYEMKKGGFEPDDISMNTLLRYCLPLRRHELAIEILDIFKYQYRLYPGPATYETLLLLAWQSRLLNFSTVIWRSACIYGAVSAKMRQFVFQSLLSYTPTLDKRIQSDDASELSNSSRYEKFKKFAGRFVIGVVGPREADLNQATDSLAWNPRKRTLKCARMLLESDLRIARKCVLKSDLPQLLRQALTMDMAWAAEGLYEKEDWREMLPHAIAVDVKVKRRRRRRPTPRLRKLVIRGRSATRFLARRRHFLRGPNHGQSPHRTSGQPTVKNVQGIKSLHRAGPPVKGRQRTRPIPVTFTPALSSIWRKCSIQRSHGSRSRPRPIAQS